MMVIYHPVKFEFDWIKRFQVRVRKRKCGRTDGRRTHQSNHATRLKNNNFNQGKVDFELGI